MNSEGLTQQPKILTLIHKETTIPGLVGQKLVNMGYELDIRAPILGDALPESAADLTSYAAVIVFGGPMSVNDDEPYLRKEAQMIRQVLAQNIPYLGICLGAQLLAKVLGAKVQPHEEAVEEIGYYPIYTTSAGTALFPPELKIYQWHKEGFDLPEGAVLLATGKDFPNQAFRWGDRAYALQFHPEMTADMVEFWSTNGSHLLTAPNAQNQREQIAGHQQYGGIVDQWLETFLNNWLPAVA